MRTDAHQFGDPLERSAGVEHDAAIDGILHSLVEVAEQRGCSLDGNEIDKFESGCPHLAGELARSMHVATERPREEWAQHTVALDVAELVEDVGQISVQLLGQHSVEMSCPPGDRRDEYRASGSHDAPRLMQCPQSVPASLKVVERSEQQHGVDRAVVEVEVGGIADGGVDVAAPGRDGQLLDVQRDHIAMTHVVTEPGQPQRVAAGAASDVRHDARRAGQMASDDLLRPLELEQTGATVEAREFQTQLVVLVHGTPFIAPSHIAFSPTTAAHWYAAPLWWDRPVRQ